MRKTTRWLLMSDNRETLTDNDIVNIAWSINGNPDIKVQGELVAKLLNNLAIEKEKNDSLQREITRLSEGPITHDEVEMVLDSLEVTLKKLAETRLSVSEIRPLGDIIHAQGVKYRKLLTKIQNWEQSRIDAAAAKRKK